MDVDEPAVAVGEGGAEDEEMEISRPPFSEAFERIFERRQQHQQDDDEKLQKCVANIDSLIAVETGSLLNGVLDLGFLDHLRIEDVRQTCTVQRDCWPFTDRGTPNLSFKESTNK